MGVEEELLSNQRKLMGEIEEAVKAKDAQAVISLSARLEEVEAMRAQVEEIKQALKGLTIEQRRSLEQILDTETVKNRKTPKPPSTSLTGIRRIPQDAGDCIQRGKEARRRFLASLKTQGVYLKPYSGSQIYKDDKGGYVGIAYASERQPERWWFGPPLFNYHALVLLCEDETGSINAIVLPKLLLDKLHYTIKDPKRDRYVLNIHKRRGEFYLKIKGQDPTNINEYLGRIEILKAN